MSKNSYEISLRTKFKKKQTNPDIERPVTMAVRPVPSIPCVTSSAVDDDERPDGPFLLNSHMFQKTLQCSTLPLSVYDNGTFTNSKKSPEE